MKGRSRRWAASVGVLWAAFQVAACESPTGPGVEAPTSLAITRVSDLVPGSQATVSGRNLDRVNGLTVDGVAVAFNASSPTSGTFQVPNLRECETDGREVAVRASEGSQATGRVRVEQTLNLRVGESRILSAEDLSCLQLARGSEAFVVTAVNSSLSRTPSGVASFRALGTRGAAPSFPSVASFAAWAPTGAAHLHDHDCEEHGHAHVVGASGTAMNGMPTLTPFADYANAQAGDIVTLVDFDDPILVWAARSKEEVPTYQGRVLAVEGNQMVILDLRTAEGRALDTPAMRDKASQAAKLAAQYMVPAIRAVMDPNFTPPPGAGGAAVTFVRPLPPGIAGLATENDMSPAQPWSSNFISGLLATNHLQGSTAGGIASTMIHEIAHSAEKVAAYYGDETRGWSHMSWYREAIATAVEDVAARLARGSLEGANPTATAPLPVMGWGNASPNRNPNIGSTWGTPGDENWTASAPSYSMGSRILRFAMENYAPGHPSAFHLEMDRRARQDAVQNGTPDMATARARWNIDAVASVLGMTRQELMAAVALQDVTGRFLDPAVASAEGIKPLRAWAHSPAQFNEQDLGQGRLLSRTEGRPINARVHGGAYDMWYVPPSPDAGLSIEAQSVSSNQDHKLIITRLR